MTTANVNKLNIYEPEFISNDYKTGRKVLTTLEDELSNCDQFNISVAFITQSGITPLLPLLKTLEEKGVPGKIMTTNYLTFSEPKALQTLSEFNNIELRMYYVEQSDPGFHPKGYMFRNNTDYNIIIGSSNWTAKALTVNKEWNVKIRSTEKQKYTDDILTEFLHLWKEAKPLDEWIDRYTKIYEEQKKIAKRQQIPSLEQYKLTPNSMQVSFINNLDKIINDGESKALLVSATGTGKTYASAFALREHKPKKALFIVHREQIAKQALESYKNVFGDTASYGLLSGTSKEYDSNIEFSTVQMMAKDDTLLKFSPQEFDIIVIDEVHRAGAESYQKIMNYFKPKFWLGMTASPERTDGYDIFKLFDHNVAYEIRLKQALEEDLLCPFYYFGITDITISDHEIDDETLELNFSSLVSDERVNHVINQTEFYGYSGDRVKGLIFCRTNDEAREISRKMNQKGFSTLALSGKNTQTEREDAIERLVSEENAYGRLDYILTVDIFNEGVDIPEINQVIMLRPTESPIVFVQQLGRGLRKDPDKEYVVVIDFIANYKNNFLIPIALSGDRSYNKDNIRKYVMEGTKVIPGSSTIYFDEISKEMIYNSINSMKTNFQLLKEKYFDLKFRIGRIPSIIDFYKHGEIDPLLFLEHSGNYHSFLQRVEKGYQPDLTPICVLYLNFLSAFIVDGKRPHESIILQTLIREKKTTTPGIAQNLLDLFEIKDDESSINSGVRLLAGKFMNSSSDKKKYKNINLLHADGSNIELHKDFNTLLENPYFAKNVNSLIELSLMKYKNEYSARDGNDNLVLYKKYSRKDVCRLLNWEKDDSSTLYGYRIKHGTCPIFVTYHKKQDIPKSTQYEDEFLSEKAFSWMTRSQVRQSSTESQQIINYAVNNLRIHLFINKSDAEGKDFYYIGKVIPVDWHETTIEDDHGKKKPIMNFRFEIENEVRDDVYDYLAK